MIKSYSVLEDRLRRECDIRAEDQIKLCQEIDALRARIAELEAQAAARDRVIEAAFGAIEAARYGRFTAFSLIQEAERLREALR